jgi:hypothetical protein
VAQPKLPRLVSRRAMVEAVRRTALRFAAREELCNPEQPEKSWPDDLVTLGKGDDVGDRGGA